MPDSFRRFAVHFHAREIFLRFKCCHASHAGGGDRLTIDVVRHVPGVFAAGTSVRVESGAVHR